MKVLNPFLLRELNSKMAKTSTPSTANNITRFSNHHVEELATPLHTLKGPASIKEKLVRN